MVQSCSAIMQWWHSVLLLLLHTVPHSCLPASVGFIWHCSQQVGSGLLPGLVTQLQIALLYLGCIARAAALEQCINLNRTHSFPAIMRFLGDYMCKGKTEEDHVLFLLKVWRLTELWIISHFTFVIHHFFSLLARMMLSGMRSIVSSWSRLPATGAQEC